MNKKSILSMLVISAFILVGSSAFAGEITGTWKNVSDTGKNKGKAASIIKIYKHKGKYYGKIMKLLIDPSDTKCTACKGKMKNKLIEGMTFVWGIKRKSSKKFEGGKILDPGNGKVYGCEMKLLSPTKLQVRGYVGFSLFGRNQYWYKTK
jgi:uncharacterized protein (DUF2147 family)